MSDKDQVKPFHAKNTAPGQEAADVVAEVLQHAAEREEAAKKKTGPKAPPKWMLPLTANLGVLALYFLIAQPDFLVLNPVEDVRGAVEVDQGARGTVYAMGIVPVQNFQRDNGRLPESLAEAGSPLESVGLPVSYSLRGDSAYVISVMIDGRELRFDSEVDDPTIFQGLIEMGG
jgi:hypothetical protein